MKGIAINKFMQISGGLLITAEEEQRVSDYTIGINVLNSCLELNYTVTLQSYNKCPTTTAGSLIKSKLST